MYQYRQWAEQNLIIVSDNGVELLIQCPNPDHANTTSAYFNTEKGLWHCFSCNAKGSVSGNELSTIEFQVSSIRSRLNKLNEVPNEEPWVMSESALIRYNLPHKYWESRGLNKNTQELFELGYDAIANAVTIPVRDITGRFQGVTRRFLDPQHIGPRYKYPKGFKASQNLFGAFLYDEYDMSTISIHEGSIDAMRLWQLGIPAVALYGSSISEHHVNQMLEMGVKKVVYFGDSDGPGQRAKERAKGYWIRPDGTYEYKKKTDLSKHFVMYHVIDHNNKKDAGDMSDAEILYSWDTAKPFQFHGDIKRKKFYVDPKLRVKSLL